MRKLSEVAISCSFAVASLSAYAASPFPFLPPYMSGINSGDVKANLMLVVDDSGSMRDRPAGISTGDIKMVIAKKVATDIVSDQNNINRFRFGLAHYFPDYTDYYFHFNGATNRPLLVNDYISGQNNMYCGDRWQRNSPAYGVNGANRKKECTKSVVLNSIKDASSASDPHIVSMKSNIGRLTQEYATPVYTTLSLVYERMPEYMQYRCQNNYVVLITDGEPNEQNFFTNRPEENRWTDGAAYARYPDSTGSLITTLKAKDTDWKTNSSPNPTTGVTGEDNEGSAWDSDQHIWPKQNIRTAVIAFDVDVPAMKTLAIDEGDGFYVTAKTGAELHEALSNILDNFAQAANPYTPTPSVSATGGLDMNALISRTFTDVKKWSGRLQFTQMISVNDAEETDSVTSNLVVKDAYYGPDDQRSTVINTPGHGVRSLDSDTLNSAGLNNTTFNIPVAYSGSNANYWKQNFVPWLAGWQKSGSAVVTDASLNLRIRGGSSADKDRYLGDVLSGSVRATGPWVDHVFDGANKTKVKKYLAVSSNDGSTKLYQHLNTENPYALKFSYIPGAAQRESGTTVMSELFNRAMTGYGSTSSFPHQHFVNGDSAAKESPRGQVVMVTTMGEGGKAAYALNVSGVKDSATGTVVGLSATTPGNWKTTVPLWDSSASVTGNPTDGEVINSLGYTISSPIISLLSMTKDAAGKPIKSGAGADSRMVTFLSNGYFSTDTTPTLYLIDTIGSSLNATTGTDNSQTGKVISKLSADMTGLSVSPSARSKNVLSSPTPVDIDGDGFADVAYAGDRNGNVYRFDFRGPTVASWTVKPVFKGDPDKPITVAPMPYLNSNNKVTVVFGTGSEVFLEDVQDLTTKQSIYAVHDVIAEGENIVGAVAVTEAELLEQTFTNGVEHRSVSSNVLGDAKKGWYVDLPDGGERITKPFSIKNRTVFINSSVTKPAKTSPLKCFYDEASAYGWYMNLDVLNGGIPTKAATYRNDAGEVVAGLKRNNTMATAFMSYNENFSVAQAQLALAYGENGEALYDGKVQFSTTEYSPLAKDNRSSVCVPGQKSWILLPSKDNPDVFVRHEMITDCSEDPLYPSGGKNIVRRLSWRVIN